MSFARGLRNKIIDVPTRITSTGRRLVLHLPTHWSAAMSEATAAVRAMLNAINAQATQAAFTA